MRMLTLLALFIGTVHTFDYEEVHDTCTSISEYMANARSSYDQKFSKEPETALTICGSGFTCCNTIVENKFYSDISRITKRVTYFKDMYIPRLAEGKQKIAMYITQVLTLTHLHNIRTKALVDEFLEKSNDDIQSIDPMLYPVSALLDIAQSKGVTELLNSTSCIAEMRDYLAPLASLQVDGLKLARFLYQALPEGEEVLKQMKFQDVSADCLRYLTMSQKCNSCLDQTSNARPCRGYCLAITGKCYSHLTGVSQSWEEFTRLTTLTMDRIDLFAKVYQAGIGRAIKAILEKLRDHDIADMCGYNVGSNLAVRNTREAPESKVRGGLNFNPAVFMVGMLGQLDEQYCERSSTLSSKCWNGTSVGLFTGDSDDIQITNDATVTDGLTAALKSMETYNKEYKKVESIVIKGPEYNTVEETEEPEFVVNKKDSAAQTVILSIGLFLVLLLLH